jgi:hypothetical protein
MNGSTRQQRDPGVVIGGDGALLHRHSQRETTNVGRQKWVRSTGRRRLVPMSVVPPKFGRRLAASTTSVPCHDRTTFRPEYCGAWLAASVNTSRAVLCGEDLRVNGRKATNG